MTTNQVAWNRNVLDAERNAETKRHNEAAEMIANKEAAIAQQRADTEARNSRIQGVATTLGTASNLLNDQSKRNKTKVDMLGSLLGSVIPGANALTSLQLHW